MSIVLFKPGTSKVINGIRCDTGVFNEYSYIHNLKNGWFYTPEDCYADEKTNGESESLIMDNINDETVEYIRARAKRLGIRNWHNKKIENIEQEFKAMEGE